MPTPTTPSEALAARIASAAGAALRALVGDRYYPVLPTEEPTGDYLVWRKAGGGGEGTRLGGVGRLQSYQLRVDVYAADEAREQAIVAAVADLLGGWQDKANGVHGCFPQPDDDQQVEDDGSAGPSGQTFQLWFKGV